MVRRAHTLLLLSIVLSISLVAGMPGQTQQGILEQDRIAGTWNTADGKAHIQISRCGETYCGTIVWLKEPEKNGRPVMDDKNPDEKLHGRPILGMQILHGFMYDGDDLWSSGRVYDPESGDEYRGNTEPHIGLLCYACVGFVLASLVPVFVASASETISFA